MPLSVTVVAPNVAVFSTFGDAQAVFTFPPVLRKPVGNAPLAVMHHS
jgi:hypothetical protein